MTTRFLVALLPFLLCYGSRGACTNIIDMSAMAIGGDGTNAEGWVLHHISSYASNRKAMRFGEDDSFVRSPDFATNLLSVTVTAVSSSAKNRRLILTPRERTAERPDLAEACLCSPTGSSFTNTVIQWAAVDGIRGFRLHYDTDGTANWGVWQLVIISEGEPEAPPPPPIDASGAISLAALANGIRHDFAPDFSSLGEIAGKTAVGGFVTNLLCAIVTDGKSEEYVNANRGTTQYQGHYAWTGADGRCGFGTYTAAGAERSFGWHFVNDTGRILRCEGIDVTFGQWGARNTQPDRLSVDWQVARSLVGLNAATGWSGREEDAFVSPALATDDAVFPLFEDRTLTSFPHQLPPGAHLVLRFTDSCPTAGNNAHLGIARLRVRLTALLPGLEVFVR